MPKGLIAIERAAGDHAGGWAGDTVALTPVANTPLLLHAVATVRRAGVEDVVVAGPSDSLGALRRALGRAVEGLHWVRTGERGGPAEAMCAAAELLDGDRFLLHCAEGMLVRDRGTLATALADSAADATVFFHAATAPVAVGPARAPAAAPEQRIAGVHAFGPAVLEVVDDLTAQSAGPVRLADAVEALAERGGVVNGGVLEDWWFYGAAPEDLLDVNRRVLDELEPSVEADDLAGARIEGRVRIHPSATVRNSVVRGPAIIGAHARVTDAFVGPYSAIGDGAVIDNAHVASSIVLPRARIRHVGVRVEDSVVGAGASIGRDFGMPHAIRLHVGAEARVTLG